MVSRKLREIIRILKRGGIIAYPTEAVFGLGCDPHNEQSVDRLLEIKKRPVSKGLIVIASSLVQLETLIDPLDKESWVRLQATWPGPVTWLVPAARAPRWLRGNHTTLAVRVTAHPVAAALCQAWGKPLVSTSANISKRPPARSALKTRLQLGGQVDYVMQGVAQGARQPTEIRDLETGQVVRSGG